ncbi:ferric reductase-like transmembrane domain-containing protein [Rhodanobacter sp. PCA2]|uniref:ferredoxin reductase family protein n=1 Tax=Rhodanobacter sp. PCA2 TaxID=2006117 RepID=UPI0015E75366|nr:ferric reductase-like transmembrane domain-containing protein [Rhodanobacter sp. PCA2]MBA2076900.1 ferric reductase [Rhodanobacter sp. PCA2]
MKRIVWTFWIFVLALSVLWLFADTLWPAQPGYFALRTAWIQYSGVLAIGAMSLAMVLATRPKWLEQGFNGLDKMYRLHKWLGIAALATATAHWLLAQGTKWAVGWGWLTRPGRRARGAGESAGGVESILRDWRGLAESVGEWAFYIAAVLLVLALVRRFPYRLFAKTHHWLAVAYLVLVFHSVVLVKFAYWAQPVGWALAVLLASGTFSAAYVLLGRVGARRTSHGLIESLQTYPALNVLETTLRMDADWPGHRTGQFAFATSDAREGAHPYTIASAWEPENGRRITLITKALGDHTRRLPERLRVNDRVKIEGPYGCFTFDDDRPRQIWIGAGIGITPFIARMKYLARDGKPDPRPIDLFHPTSTVDPLAIEKLRADSVAAGVTLHLFASPQGGLLTGEHLRAVVPGWREASVWFCGPAAFGRDLCADLVAAGLPREAFHQELFEMR